MAGVLQAMLLFSALELCARKTMASTAIRRLHMMAEFYREFHICAKKYRGPSPIAQDDGETKAPLSKRYCPFSIPTTGSGNCSFACFSSSATSHIWSSLRTPLNDGMPESRMPFLIFQ